MPNPNSTIVSFRIRALACVRGTLRALVASLAVIPANLELNQARQTGRGRPPPQSLLGSRPRPQRRLCNFPQIFSAGATGGLDRHSICDRHQITRKHGGIGIGWQVSLSFGAAQALQQGHRSRSPARVHFTPHRVGGLSRCQRALDQQASNRIARVAHFLSRA